MLIGSSLERITFVWSVARLILVGDYVHQNNNTFKTTDLCDFSLPIGNHSFVHLSPSKTSFPSIIGLITSIINSSLSTVPSLLKVAKNRSTLKITVLDSSDPNNYGPVTNLSFISITLERIVASHLQDLPLITIISWKNLKHLPLA